MLRLELGPRDRRGYPRARPVRSAVGPEIGSLPNQRGASTTPTKHGRRASLDHPDDVAVAILDADHVLEPVAFAPEVGRVGPNKEASGAADDRGKRNILLKVIVVGRRRELEGVRRWWGGGGSGGGSRPCRLGGWVGGDRWMDGVGWVVKAPALTGKMARPIRRPPRKAMPQPAQVPAKTVLNDVSSPACGLLGSRVVSYVRAPEASSSNVAQSARDDRGAGRSRQFQPTHPAKS